MRAHPLRLRLAACQGEFCTVSRCKFITYGQQLPAGYWGSEPVSAPLWDAWKEAVKASQHDVWPVCVLGGIVVFLQIRADPPLQMKDLVLDDCEKWFDYLDSCPGKNEPFTLEIVQQNGLAGLSKLTLCALQREMASQRGKLALADG
ncbi:uncharacterized protein LOC129600657 [Paramacrobiotus metropolitanus]|uniref:uncharacterized protein LOC129600657 n=1 Tax=Paramacrobiotus metropolitanus TaxID=2943436 RepID=UPI0024459399|nr:uncharacterized protein LOC129600657 [Paramacrobiotus metropolitanus]